ncbi:MAG: hypothetical protein LIO65_03095 [Odoribacter sp.]|nr:hypothetical protein [Odoribacter sp.]
MKSLCNTIFCALFLTISICFSAYCNTKEKKEIYIIPIHQELTVNHGFYLLNSRSAIDIDVNNEELKSMVTYFNEKINVATGFSVPIKKEEKLSFY